MIQNIGFQNLVNLWIMIMLCIAMICFLVSEITHNYSQVDKLWSLMPIAYGWITVAYSPSPRLIIMAILVTIWGLRLSYNFLRKGGYHIIPWKGAEDYRWQVMREHPLLKGRIRFSLFNLFFISLCQNILILLFSSPLLLSSLYPEKSLTLIDLIAAILMLTFILIESIADNQQFQFQQEKLSGMNVNTRYKESSKKGFLSEGLWGYARHPNFTSEQGVWISFYLFGVASSGQWINPTLTGSIMLILLFGASTRLTESISSRKYPDYGLYKSEIPKFIPDLREIFKRKK